jgi:hypothetical protein
MQPRLSTFNLRVSTRYYNLNIPYANESARSVWMGKTEALVFLDPNPV